MVSSWPDVYESFHSFPGHSVFAHELLQQQRGRGCGSCRDPHPCLAAHPSPLLPQGLIPTGCTMSWLPPAETPWAGAIGIAANHVMKITSDLCQIHFSRKARGHFLS